MPKALNVTTPIPASATSSEKPDHRQLTAIALFCGAGLLVSLVAVLMGVQGAWY
jgi:hypothetical protein